MNINKRTFVNNKLDVLACTLLQVSFFGDDLLVWKLLNKFLSYSGFRLFRKKQKPFCILSSVSVCAAGELWVGVLVKVVAVILVPAPDLDPHPTPSQDHTLDPGNPGTYSHSHCPEYCILPVKSWVLLLLSYLIYLLPWPLLICIYSQCNLISVIYISVIYIFSSLAFMLCLSWKILQKIQVWQLLFKLCILCLGMVFCVFTGQPVNSCCRSLSVSSVSSVSSASSSSSSVRSADSDDMYADLASPVSSASSRSPTPNHPRKERGPPRDRSPHGRDKNRG